MKRLYLDNCCYNRPYDDLTQERIHLESEAIVAIIKRGRQHIDEIVGSDIIDLEMEQSDDESRKEKVKILYAVIVDKAHYDKSVYDRSVEIKCMNKAIRSMDSLHLASAESGHADILLTTDDKFERACAKIKLGVTVMNPLKYMMEVMQYE
jgi:predicted nucleic acid-binding protein